MNSLPLCTRMTVRKMAKAKSNRPMSRLHLAARQKTSEAEAGGVQAMVGVKVRKCAPLATLHWVGSGQRRHNSKGNRRPDNWLGIFMTAASFPVSGLPLIDSFASQRFTLPAQPQGRRPFLGRVGTATRNSVLSLRYSLFRLFRPPILPSAKWIIGYAKYPHAIVPPGPA